MRKIMQKTVLLLVAGLFLTGCHSLRHKKRCGCKKKDLSAVAEIKSVSKTSVKGRVQFDQADRGKVRVTAEVRGLKPNAQLGFHLHEFGDCSNKGLSAGGHFNPKGHKHGGPSHKERHLGDLGNLKTDAKGQAVYSKVIPGKLYKFLGRSIVIHSKTDDLKTQPAGASGGRVACGIVGAARKLSSVEAKEKDSAAPVTATAKKAAMKKAVKTKKAVETKKTVKTKKVVETKKAVKTKKAVETKKTVKTEKAVETKKTVETKKAVGTKKVVKTKGSGTTNEDNDNEAKAKAKKTSATPHQPAVGTVPSTGKDKKK